MLPPRSSNQIKSGKTKNAEAHTSPTKFGMGDYYGSGQKAKIGKMRGHSVGCRPVTKSQMSKPPKSLA